MSGRGGFSWRTRRIQVPDGSTGEPFKWGFELDHWNRADVVLLRETEFLYVAGGKRATKSEWAAKRFVESAMEFPHSIKWAFQASGKTSVATQQKLVWKYLPNWVKKLNGKARHGMAKVNYSVDGGFTEGVLVLPNLTEIHFLTFKSDPKDYQGWELGTYMNREIVRRLEANPHLNNIGAWLDEDCPMTWLKTAEMRCASRKAKIIWTFSTLNGITTAVKEVLGEPKTVESRPAELLDRKRAAFRIVRRGICRLSRSATRKGWKAIYFHTIFNTFGDNYAQVAARCEGKAFTVVAEDAYGYSEDARRRCGRCLVPGTL
jgi:hypothetical protein